MGLEPRRGSPDVQNKLFTDHIKESRSSNVTAFLYLADMSFPRVTKERVGNLLPSYKEKG